MKLRIEGRLTARPQGHARTVLAIALAAMAAFAVFAFEMRAITALLGMAVSTAVAGMAAFIGRTSGRPIAAAIEIEGERVDVAGAIFQRGDVVSAHRHDQRAVLELADGRGYELAAPRDQIDALIDALGFSSGRRVQRFRVGGFADPSQQVLGTVFAVASSVFALSFAAGAVMSWMTHEPRLATTLALAALLLTPAAARFARSIRRTAVYVGSDGARVRVGTQAARFFPFARCEVRREGSTLSLASGVERASIRCASEREATTLEAALEAASAGRTQASVDVTPLMRGSDSVESWKARLLSLLSPGAYRALLGPDELARVVEDSTAKGEVRVAAALALSALAEGTAERTRVRVAIESVASPSLRVALERADAGELDVEMLAREPSRR